MNLAALDDAIARKRLTPEYRQQQGRDHRRTAADRWRETAARMALRREKMQAYKPETIRDGFTNRARLVPLPTPADMGKYITDAEKYLAAQNAMIANYLARADLRDALRDLSLGELVQEAKTTAATSRDPAAVETAAARLSLIRRAARSHQGEEMFRFGMNQIDDAINTLPLPDQDAEVLRLAAEIETAAAAAESAFREIADPNYTDISDKVEAVARDGAETYISGIRERNQEHAQAVQDAAAKLTTNVVLSELKADLEAERQNREGATNGN